MKLLLRCALLSFVPAILSACTAPSLTEPATQGRLNTQTVSDTTTIASSGGGEAGTTSSEGESAPGQPGVGTLGSGN